MNKEFKWTDAEVKKILHAATGNIKDFVMDNDGFLADFKASHTTEEKRDWEIVSFIEKEEEVAEGDDPFILPVNTIPSCYKLEMYLAPDSCFNIHSVRRTIDGEVFTLGDKVSSTWGLQRITRFFTDGDEVIVEFATCRNPLSKISKPLQRTPLLITDDEVSLYNRNDKYWRVYDDWSTGLFEVSHPTSYTVLANFASEDKAKEYVILNKPCLSVQDVLSICDTTFEFEKLHTGRLKELAKQKLNKQ